MAEESRLKRIISGKVLLLQEREHHEHVFLCEEHIMSRDTSQLGDMAQRYYELKQLQIFRTLEENIEKNKENECSID